MKDSGVDWIGEIPEGWETKRFKYLYDYANTGEAITKEFWEEDGEVLLYTAGQNPVRTNYIEFPISRVTTDRDVLVARNGAGAIQIPEKNSIYTDHVIRFSTRNLTNRNFIYYCLSLGLEKIVSEQIDVSLKTLSKSDWDQLQLPFPATLEEQQAIANYLDKQTSKFDQAQKLLKDEIERLRAYKKSLIYETVTKGLDKSVQLKDSGVDWIGKIPEGWEVTKIKFSTTLNGRIGWQGLTSSEYQTEGPYLITGTDFNNGQINFETAVHIENHRWEEAKHIQIKNGDLLITKDGTVGKVAIVTNLNDKASLNSGVLKIQPMPEIYTKFLYYVLISEEFWLWFNYTNSGASTILHLYQNVFDEFSYAIPLNRRQQKAIVDYLDEKINKIDQIIEIKEQQLKKISEQRKTLIYEIVTGKKKINVG